MQIGPYPQGEIAEIGSQLTAATAHMDLFRSRVLDRVKKLEETMVPDLRIFFEDTDQTQTSDLNSQFEEKVERLRATLVAELDAHRSHSWTSRTRRSVSAWTRGRWKWTT